MSVRIEAKKYIQSLSDKQAVEFLYEVLADRPEGKWDRPDEKNRWVLACTGLNEPQSPNPVWELLVLAQSNSTERPDNWDADSPICQEGTCDNCGISFISWAKNLICPVCDEEGYGT